MHNNDKMKKICFILPYFGEFKSYFPYFLQSCKNNPTIDWIIYTDCHIDFLIPDNIIIHQTSWQEFSNKIRDYFDFEISLETPYKLCDFKPAYGEIFYEDIKDYDFWGHCDCDLIFGNIRKFITNDILEAYDRVGNCGHFILYRNNAHTNAYYRLQTHMDYRMIFSDSKNYSFDEWPGISEYWHMDGKSCYDNIIYDDVRTGYSGFRCSKEVWGGYIGPYHDMYNDCRRYLKMKYIVYSYHNGTLKRIWLQGTRMYEEEVLYVHLQKRTMLIEEKASVNEYLIIPNSFVVCQELNNSNLKTLASAGRKDWISAKKRQTTKNILIKDIRSIGENGYIKKAAWIGFLKSLIGR